MTRAPSSELRGVMAEVHREYGEHVMVPGTLRPYFNHCELGIFILDFALLGGIPEGLVAQIYGWEAAGKSTLAMRLSAHMQRKYPDKSVVYIDAEHSLDPTWAQAHGCDMERIYLVQPESGEQAVDILTAVSRASDTSLVILDSLPAIVPFKEADESAEDAQVATRARLIGRMCSKILDSIGKERARGHWCTFLFINQWRMRIGGGPGDPRVLPGGMQPRFLSSVMFEIKNQEKTEQDARGIEIATHNVHSFKFRKNKVGNSVRSGEFTLIRNPGHPLGVGAIDEAATVVTYAKKLGVVTGGGTSWRVELENLSCHGTRFGRLGEIQGHLETHPEDSNMLKRHLIGMQRQEMSGRALPPDGYLYGWPIHGRTRTRGS